VIIFGEGRRALPVVVVRGDLFASARAWIGVVGLGVSFGLLVWRVSALARAMSGSGTLIMERG
jgi:hypothetical protein